MEHWCVLGTSTPRLPLPEQHCSSHSLLQRIPNQNQGLRQTRHQDILSPGQGVKYPSHACWDTGNSSGSSCLPTYLRQHPAREQSKPCLVPRSSYKNSLPGRLGRGKLQSSPALPSTPPKTPANTFCPPPSLPSPCKADFQQPQTELLGSKLPPILGVRAVAPPGLCLSCWDGVWCFTESLLRLLSSQLGALCPTPR